MSKDHLNRDSLVDNRDAIISGAISGAAVRLLVSPLDVLKIRFQLQVKSGVENKYNGLLQSVRTILREEGFRGFWKGNISAELLYLFYGAVQFSTYNTINQMLNHLQQEYSYQLPQEVQSFVAGASAGCTSVAATYPFDVLRTRFAIQGNGNERIFQSIPHAVRHIYTREGISAFYSGLKPALLAVAPYMGSLFFSYELFRNLLEPVSLNSKLVEPTCGILAGLVSKGIVFPLDLVRRRMQVQGPDRLRYIVKGVPQYPKSIHRCCLIILQQEGVRGLYKGFFVSLLKAAPTSALSIWFYELSLRMTKSLRRLKDGR